MTLINSRIQTVATRRDLMKGAGALALAGGALMIAVRPSFATPETMRAAIGGIVGKAEVGNGRISIDIPQLVENGNTVPVVVAVESPMTATDYVRAIHIFNEKNPQPNVIGIHLGPRAGRARVSTRIRLSDTQKVVVVAELSDGSFWSTSADVIVTLAACLEDNLK